MATFPNNSNLSVGTCGFVIGLQHFTYCNVCIFLFGKVDTGLDMDQWYAAMHGETTQLDNNWALLDVQPLQSDGDIHMYTV